eukprot:1136776-Pelagomonas_calceolata.AAC.2
MSNQNNEGLRTPDHSPGLRSLKKGPQLRPETISTPKIMLVVENGDLVVEGKVHAAADQVRAKTKTSVLPCDGLR